MPQRSGVAKLENALRTTKETFQRGAIKNRNVALDSRLFLLGMTEALVVAAQYLLLLHWTNIFSLANQNDLWLPQHFMIPPLVLSGVVGVCLGSWRRNFSKNIIRLNFESTIRSSAILLSAVAVGMICLFPTSMNIVYLAALVLSVCPSPGL